MTKRNFPGDLMEVRAFLLWQSTGKADWTMMHHDGTAWQFGKHHEARPLHTLRELLMFDGIENWLSTKTTG